MPRDGGYSVCLSLRGNTQFNLDANVSGAAEAVDTHLVNGWGLARSSGGTWWVSDEATGFSTLYNGAGDKQSLVVTIPKSNPDDPTFPNGAPTGAISNGSTPDFLLAPNKPAASRNRILGLVAFEHDRENSSLLLRCSEVHKPAISYNSATHTSSQSLEGTLTFSPLLADWQAPSITSIAPWPSIASARFRAESRMESIRFHAGALSG